MFLLCSQCYEKNFKKMYHLLILSFFALLQIHPKEEPGVMSHPPPQPPSRTASSENCDLFVPDLSHANPCMTKSFSEGCVY